MLTKFKEYEKYVSGLSLDSLLDIEANIDKNKYPERYKLVLKLIEKNKIKTLPK